MKKLLSVLLSLLLLGGALCSVPAGAVGAGEAVTETTTTPAPEPTEPGEFALTIDPNKRANIEVVTDGLLGQLASGAQEAARREQNRKIWIGVLVFLLVVAVIMLLISLRRVPKKDELEDEFEEEFEKKAGPGKSGRRKKASAKKEEPVRDAIEDNRVIKPLKSKEEQLGKKEED